MNRSGLGFLHSDWLFKYHPQPIGLHGSLSGGQAPTEEGDDVM